MQIKAQMENLLFKSVGIPLEVKEITDKFIHIEGLASTFGTIDRVGDIIAKGAFSETLTKRMPKFLFQHDMDEVLGVIDQASEVEEGLFIKARMPKELPIAQKVLPLLQMGALSDFSIGFNVLDSDTTPDGNRTIKEIDLWEISIVTIPANPDAKITGVKKLDIDEKIVDAEMAESINTRKEFEQLLKNTGMFTRKAKVILASRFKEIISQGDLSEKKKGQSDSVNEEKLLMEAMDKLKKSLTKD